MRAIALSIPFLLWGYHCIATNKIGPMLGGSFSILLGAFLFITGLIYLIDRLFPLPILASRDPRQEPLKPHDDRYEYLFGAAQHLTHRERAELSRMNTPDPNLIHPDDLKPKGSGRYDYSRS